MIRKPVVAGRFYSANRDELIKEIEGCFSSPFGPTVSFKSSSFEKILGLISPHAGYVFSGPCAAHGFHALKNTKVEEKTVFVILGVNHTGLGNSGISLYDFETPLGVAKNNRFLSIELSKLSNIPLDESPHVYEHSIEVQIPFLQYLFKDKFTIVPAVIDADTNFDLFGEALVRLTKEHHQNIIVIASSDFTHYGIDYHYTPFGQPGNKEVERDDFESIKIILKKDAETFLDRANQRTICGRYTITALLKYLAKLEEHNESSQIKGELLKYYQSSEIYPSDSFVGYASIVFGSNKKE